MSEEKRPRGRARKDKPSVDNTNNQNDSVESKNEGLRNQDDDFENEGNGNDDDLREFQKNNKNTSGSNSEPSNSIDDEVLSEIKQSENIVGSDDIPASEFDILAEPAKERSYTGGMNSSASNSSSQQPASSAKVEERIIPEPAYNTTGASKPDVEDDLINPTGNSGTNDIPDESGGGKSGSGKTSSSGSSTSVSSSSSNKKELSPTEKRKEAEKDADAILLAYKNYSPLIFGHFASYSIPKLEKLHKKGEIDLTTPVGSDGITFREYALQFNLKVDETFEVSQSEIDAIREPLVDVFIEQEMAFTPMQRLMMTAGQFLLLKTISCFKIVSEKKSDIEEMREANRERIDALERQAELDRKERADIRAEERRVQKEKEDRDKERERIRKEQEDADKRKSESSSVKSKDTSDAEIISEVKNEVSPPVVVPTLDDALNVIESEEVDKNESAGDIPS